MRTKVFVFGGRDKHEIFCSQSGPPSIYLENCCQPNKNDECPLHIIVLVCFFFVNMASRNRYNNLLYSDESTYASSVDFDCSGDESDGETASNDYHRHVAAAA